MDIWQSAERFYTSLRKVKQNDAELSAQPSNPGLLETISVLNKSQTSTLGGGGGLFIVQLDIN